MSEEFNKLSQEQLNKLAKVISEAKSLTSRQAEIIESVLAGEMDIGELRLAYLKKFYDAYSASLDNIATRQSKLNHAYLILEKRAAALRKQAQEEAGKEIPTGGSKKSHKKNTPKSASTSSDTEKTTKQTASASGSKKSPTKDDSAKKPINIKVSVKTDKPTDEAKQSGGETRITAEADIRATIDKLVQACRQKIAGLADDIASAEEAISNTTGENQRHQIEQFKKFAGEKEKLENSIRTLELLRHKADVESTKQSTDLRINGAQEALAAEQNSRKLIQELDTEEVTVPEIQESVAGVALSDLKLEPVLLDDAVQNSVQELREALEAIDLDVPDFSDDIRDVLETVELDIDAATLGSNIEDLRDMLSAIDLSDLTLTDDLESLRTTLQAVPLSEDSDGMADIIRAVLAVAEDVAIGIDGLAASQELPGLEAVELTTPTAKVSNTLPDSIFAQLLGESSMEHPESDDDEEKTNRFSADIRVAELMQKRLLNEEEYWEDLVSTAGAVEEVKQRGSDRLQKRELEIAAMEEELNEAILDLDLRRYNKELQLKEDEYNLTELRLASMQEATEAQTKAFDAVAAFRAKMAFAGEDTIVDENGNDTGINQAGQNMADQRMAELMQAVIAEKEAQAAEYEKMREAELRAANGGELSAADATRIQKEKAEKFSVSLDEASLKELANQKAEKDARALLKEEETKNLAQLKEGNFKQKKEALYKLTHDSDGTFNKEKALNAALQGVTDALADFAKKLEETMDEIASKKAPIDTRLNGSKNEKFAGSYWDQITKDIMSVGAITPFFKQETFASKVEELVGQGIAFEVEQRAFLMTIQDKISTTFNVVDSTMLRLIRIQQENATAGRMGMEIALNAFLNNMYETTEYLQGISESVRSNMAEMQSLMTASAATEVEYQVQKWLGSLYSVGMSQDAVSAISNALGQIASGQIEGLTGDGAGNLLIMAANNADLSIADILTDGIDASDTNKLLQATVNYLAELAEASKDNKIVQQQLANVFGVKASDLKAATNLVSQDSVSTIYSNSMTYNSMVGQLYSMAGSMAMRTSMAEMMQNVWDNAQYTIAAGMASTPVAYLTYKLAGLMDDTLGGIDLPFLNVYGFGIDLNTTISDLMRIASMGAGILGSLGSVISGLGNSFSGVAMLQQMGVGPGGPSVITRGNGSGLAGGGGSSTSSSGSMTGNSSGSDVTDSTKQQAKDDGDEQMIEAEEEKKADRVDEINDNVLKIYELLADVTKGKESLKVKIEGYGLTGGSISGGGGAQGGVEALDNASSNGGVGGAAGGSSTSSSGGFGGSSGGSAGGGAGSASNSGTSGGGGRSIDLGGWTML